MASSFNPPGGGGRLPRRVAEAPGRPIASALNLDDAHLDAIEQSH